jgi:hypothetical protein
VDANGVGAAPSLFRGVGVASPCRCAARAPPLTLRGVLARGPKRKREVRSHDLLEVRSNTPHHRCLGDLCGDAERAPDLASSSDCTGGRVPPAYGLATPHRTHLGNLPK